MELVFVGTGVSTAIPVIGHNGNCACRDAIQTPHSKNKRNNVSLLISCPMSHAEHSRRVAETTERLQRQAANTEHLKRPCDDVKVEDLVPRYHHVLIDCGKTFRSAYFEHLVHRNVRQIDALLLTHDHADAVLGVDDLRDLQPFEMKGLHYVCHHNIPTFLGKTTLDTLKNQVGYIVRNSRALGDAPSTKEDFDTVKSDANNALPEDKRIIERRSTVLDFFLIDEDAPQRFYVPGLPDHLPFYSLPVEHGKDYISLGYVFGHGVRFKGVASDDEEEGVVPTNRPTKGDCVVYISDVSSIPPKSKEFLHRLHHVDLLVIDVLYGKGETHFSHFCLDDAWNLVKELLPKRVLAVGMFCDLEHNTTNAQLKLQLEAEHAAGSCIGVESFELACDGLVVHVDV